MAYRRSYRRSSMWGSIPDRSNKVTVSLVWDQLSEAGYLLKFTNIGKHWDKCEAVIMWIKSTIPSSQREYMPEEKTWLIGEKFFVQLRDIVKAITDFEVTVVEKPEGVQAHELYTSESKQRDYERFKQIISMAQVSFADTLELTAAKKAYVKAAFKFHPDRSPDTAYLMTELNEIFTRLKGAYFTGDKDATTTVSQEV